MDRIKTLLRRILPPLARDVLLPFAVTRLGLCLIAWLGFALWRPATIDPQAWQIDSDGDRQPIATIPSNVPHPFVNMWSRWDAGWYLEIARSGYSYEPGQPSSIAFFPLYPVLIRFIHTALFLPDDDYWFLVSGIILSNISLLVALIYFRALLQIDYGTGTLQQAIIYLLVFPTSFFLSSVYSESFFLVLSIAAFYYARRARWIPACLLASLAALCRSQGILLVLPLLAEYLQQQNFSFGKLRWQLLQILIVPVPLVIFLLYLQTRFGNWRLIFDAQEPWGRQVMRPWDSLSWIVRHFPPLSAAHHEWLDFAFLCLLAAAAMIGLWKLRLSYSVYAWGAVIFFSSWGMLGSMPRFDLMIFPLFIVLASIGERSNAFHVGYLITASMLSGFFMLIHSQWNWVA